MLYSKCPTVESCNIERSSRSFLSGKLRGYLASVAKNALVQGQLGKGHC
jgi:hypothetical protein